MIESELDPLTDGTGGGFGKYPGLTVEQVAERFRFLAAEGEGRSVRAILRIVHEQTEARGGLSTQRLLVGLGLLVTVGLFLFRSFAAPETRSQVTLYLAVSTGLTILFAVGAASVHRATVRGEAQVREIRRLALLALERVIANDSFVQKALEREHIAALKTLRKIDPVRWQKVSDTLSGTS